jgi:hypothetical protein
LGVAFQPEAAHDLGLSQVVRYQPEYCLHPGSGQSFSLPFPRRLIISMTDTTALIIIGNPWRW